MKNSATPFSRYVHSFRGSLIFATFALLLAFGFAQAASGATRIAPRIGADISSNQMTQVPGSLHPQAQTKYDTGRLSPATKLEGISLYLSRTPQQELALQKLIVEQQNPSSAQYHQWLTPEQFAARFGVADADIAKIQSWLEQQGFSVDSVARSKNVIRFTGTAGQVERAFATEMHTYSVPSASGKEQHFAPSTSLSVPAAMSPVVLAVRNLDDFRPKSHIVKSRFVKPKPRFTSYDDSGVFFAPGDIATVYDINPAYSAGNTGVGQTIAIIGQSAIQTSDIEAFQNAAGLAIKDPAVTLVPNTGSSTLQADGDETESDLDLEWSGAIARGATISFVYTGSDPNYGAFDSLQYAIENKIGTIISSSYGNCEALIGTSAIQSLETFMEQASSQGQTVISAAGDDGSTDCFQGTNVTDPTLSAQEALAVDYPASSPNVTGVGGTEIAQSQTSYQTPGSAYWGSANGSSDLITSALQYIPEQGWNEESTSNCGQYNCLLAGGGGASAVFSKPSWQTGVTGIPADGKRDVPDIALNAATNNPGYLFCSSDPTDWASDQSSSCTSGFRDATSGELTYAGGTSFAAPIFAGMVAIINQQQGYTTGEGLVNPTLYTLASDATTYSSAFHDITIGNNQCQAGSDFCNGTPGFLAGVGYDQVTGLGSLDLGNLVGAWPASTSTLIGTTTTIAPSTTSPQVGANVTFAIAVASSTGSSIPTGTVQITIDGATAATLTLSNGAASYTTTFATAGGHTVLATYSGDATHATSNSTVTITATAVNSGKGSFTLSGTNITITDGTVGTSTVTVTPIGGYTGTVTFTMSLPSQLANACPVLNNIAVSGTTPATGNESLDTNAQNCATTGNSRKARSVKAAGILAGLDGRGGPIAASLAFGLLLMAGLMGRSSRKFRMFAGVLVLGAVGLVFSGCGGNNNNTINNPPKGTYTVTLTGTDSTSSTITTSTTFSITLQ